jgi:hypothetical protein
MAINFDTYQNGEIVNYGGYLMVKKDIYHSVFTVTVVNGTGDVIKEFDLSFDLIKGREA